jgi:hypothetical protein
LTKQARPALRKFLVELGLPSGFGDRTPVKSQRVKVLLEFHTAQTSGVSTGLRRGKKKRTYLTGLLLAFVAVCEDLLKQVAADSLLKPLEKYPPISQDKSGNLRYTLSLRGPVKTVSLRPYYNKAEQTFRGKLRRLDYPNMAPHATQAWPDYKTQLVDIFGFSPGERLALADALWDTILNLPEFTARPKTSVTVRPFEKLLSSFPAEREDPPGALLQGLAFAYYRADAPNLTLETRKVGAGGRRTGNVGDIDGWSGDDLVLSIEVKDRNVDLKAVTEIESGFSVNLAEWPDATAIVLARAFSDDAKAALQDRNVRVLDRRRMAANVRLWDLHKQRLAMREFQYFLFRKQQHSGMRTRFEKFVADNSLPFG